MRYAEYSRIRAISLSTMRDDLAADRFHNSEEKSSCPEIADLLAKSWDAIDVVALAAKSGCAGAGITGSA
jgi:hypothetical protein